MDIRQYSRGFQLDISLAGLGCTAGERQPPGEPEWDGQAGQQDGSSCLDDGRQRFTSPGLGP